MTPWWFDPTVSLFFAGIFLLIFFTSPQRGHFGGAPDFIPFFLLLIMSSGTVVDTALKTMMWMVPPHVLIARAAITFIFVTMYFAIMYWSIGTSDNFKPKLTRWDAIYFSLGTFTTAGTGEIAPISWLSKLVVSVQMLAGLVYLTVVLAIAISKLNEGRPAWDPMAERRASSQRRVNRRASLPLRKPAKRRVVQRSR